MSARFEIKVVKDGFEVHDDYWDTVKFVRTGRASGIVADAIKLVQEQIDNGSKEKWFAVGESGHAKIFEKPTICFAIPGRNLRYKK